MTDFGKIFIDVFNKNGLGKYSESVGKFEELYNMLVKANSEMNLTAITDAEAVCVRHFADCCYIADGLPENARVVDIGAGGGFPTLPLAVVRPDLRILAVDSVAKKLTFIDGVAAELGLNVATLSERAEVLGQDENYRENYDVCISRAVARLDILSELCLPLVRVSGSFFALKGREGMTELAEAETGIECLGGSLKNTVAYTLSDGSERYVFEISKTSTTESKYPRRYNRIKKEPLR